MVGAVLSLFLLVTKRLYGKDREWSFGQIKTSRKKQHVKIHDLKEMPDLICGKAAVGRNYNSTYDREDGILHWESGCGNMFSIRCREVNLSFRILHLQCAKRTRCNSSCVKLHKIALGKLVFQKQFMCNIPLPRFVAGAFGVVV